MSKRHEQLLFHYSSALERGDFEAVAGVLREAERDPALEALILQMNDAYTAERFNHANPKEIPMIAAIYPNPTLPRTPRIRWHSLPLVAALGVIALLSVMLAAQMRGNNIFNTGQPGTSGALALQPDPTCNTGALALPVTFYSRPSADAAVLRQGYGTSTMVRDLIILDRTSVDDQGWYFVQVATYTQVQGWITAEQYAALEHCAEAAVVPPAVSATLSPDGATAVPNIAQQPFFVVTMPSGDVHVTYVPPDVQALPSFTPTPAPLHAEASPLPPTIVPPEPIEADGIAVAATDLARLGEGGVCKATTLRTAAVRSLPSPEGVVVTSLPRNTIVTVGDYATSRDAQGNPTVWYVVGVDEVRGWMLATLLDDSACPPILNASVDLPATQLAETRLYVTATAMIQAATAQASAVPVETGVIPPSELAPTAVPFRIDTAAMPPQSMLERAGNCTTTIRTTTDVLSLPSDDGVVIGSLPPGTVVAVIDTQVYHDGQNNSVLWYFVAAHDLQGWVSVYALEAPGCPQSQSEQMTLPPTLAQATSIPQPTPTLAR